MYNLPTILLIGVGKALRKGSLFVVILSILSIIGSGCRRLDSREAIAAYSAKSTDSEEESELIRKKRQRKWPHENLMSELIRIHKNKMDLEKAEEIQRSYIDEKRRYEGYPINPSIVEHKRKKIINKRVNDSIKRDRDRVRKELFDHLEKGDNLNYSYFYTYFVKYGFTIEELDNVKEMYYNTNLPPEIIDYILAYAPLRTSKVDQRITKDVARALLRTNAPIEVICEATGYTPRRIESLEKESRRGFYYRRLIPWR